jgi:transcriptional regulator with XRE-family HTH domain
MEYIEQNIKRLAKKHHITLESLAQNVGFSKIGFYKLFKNQTYKLETLIKIAKELDSSVIELISKNDSQSTELNLSHFIETVKPLNNKGFISVHLDVIIEKEYESFFVNSSDIRAFITTISTRSTSKINNSVQIPEHKLFNLIKLTNEEWIECASTYFGFFYDQRNNIDKLLKKELDEYIIKFITEFKNQCLAHPVIINLMNSHIYEENIVKLEVCKTLQLKLFKIKSAEYILKLLT